MADKRIIELEESTTIAAGDYFAIDSNAGGTCKANAGIITNQFADMQNILGSKNLLQNKATSKAENGLTLTVNDDGSVTVNGTATADEYFSLGSSTLPAGEYILSGCPAGGSSTKYRLYIFNSNGGATIISEYGNGASFTLAEETIIVASILVMNGQTMSNATYYPMVRPAAVPNNAYEPYAASNAGLTKDVNALKNGLVWEDVTSEFTFNSGLTSKKAIYNPVTKEVKIFMRATNVANSTEWVTIPAKFKANLISLIPVPNSANRYFTFGQFMGIWSSSATANQMTYTTIPQIDASQTNQRVIINYVVNQTAYNCSVEVDYIAE